MTVFKQVSQIFPLSEMLLFIYFLVCKIYYYHFLSQLMAVYSQWSLHVKQVHYIFLYLKML